MIIKKIRFIAILLTTFAAILLLASFLIIEPLSAIPVEGVKTGDFSKQVVLTGSLKARKAEHFIVPMTNTWQIQIKWMAKEGDTVKPGDPVVRFDTSNLATESENLEMTLQGKEEEKLQKLADYHHQSFELNVQLKQAEIDYKKKEIDASIPKGLETNYDYDKKQLELKQSKQALDNAKLEKKVKLAALQSELKRIDIEIQEAQLKLEKNQELLKSLNLSAKTAGTVVYALNRWERRKIQIGDNVPATWTVATIPNTESLEVEAWVNETQIQHIMPGQKVRLVLDAYADRTFTGEVKDILKSAEKRSHWGKAHYFNVAIGLDQRDPKIMKPGMSVKCIVQVASFTDVALVPLEMVDFDGHIYKIDIGKKTPIEVEPLGINRFYLALDKKEALKLGVL